MQTILKRFGDQRHAATPERILWRRSDRHPTTWPWAEAERCRQFPSCLWSKIPRRRARFVRYGLPPSVLRRDHAKRGTKKCPRPVEDRGYGVRRAIRAAASALRLTYRPEMAPGHRYHWFDPYRCIRLRLP